MQINKIQTTNFNTQNPNFKAIKKIRFSKCIQESTTQEKLINALKQSKGIKEFFEKNDGIINFSRDGFIVRGGKCSIDTKMNILYKPKNKIFAKYKNYNFIETGNSLEDSANQLSKRIENLSYETLK